MTIVPDSWDENAEPLTPEQEAELEESIAELERGEFVTAEASLREVREILYRRSR
jgi:predicted transcriptional regulator